MRHIGLIIALSLMTALILGTGVAFTPSSGPIVEYRTHDDLLMEIGQLEPEFGGMYLSEDNTTLYVYLTGGTQDMLKQRAVKESIEQVLEGDLTSNRIIRILPAQYPMSQLYEWYKRMMSDVFSNPNVTMTDLSEGQNRIEIGVESLDAVPDLESILTNLGIPREAVIFSEIGRAVPLSHDLEDRATGGVVEGGYKISSSFGACTLGFNTERDGVAGFVTAGHCTENKHSQFSIGTKSFDTHGR